MAETASAGVRERVWITVIDHEHDPPQPIKETFFENGELQSVTDLTTGSAPPAAVSATTS